jgi:hypothetical protein
MKGILTWSVRWTRRAGTIDFFLALAALVSPVQNIIFLTAHFSLYSVPIAQQHGHWAGRRAAWVACLCVSALKREGGGDGTLDEVECFVYCFF